MLIGLIGINMLTKAVRAELSPGKIYKEAVEPTEKTGKIDQPNKNIPEILKSDRVNAPAAPLNIQRQYGIESRFSDDVFDVLIKEQDILS